MPRPEKVAAVAEIKERIDGAQGVFITEYRGLTVKQMQTLRRALRDSGAGYQVVKMTLARRAVEELGLDEISKDLVGPSGIAYADTDVVATAKVLSDMAKQFEKLVVKSGILEGKVIPPEKVSALADLESREVLLSKIAGAAKAPLAKMAGMLGSFTRDAASMFSQLLEKKEAVEGPAPAAAVAPKAEAPTEEASTEVAEEASKPPASDEPAPAAEAPVEDEPAPAAEAPVEDEPAPAAEASVEDEPAPAAEAPVEDEPAPAAEAPVEDEPAPAAEAPVEDEPAPAAEAPVEDEPAPAAEEE